MVFASSAVTVRHHVYLLYCVAVKVNNNFLLFYRKKAKKSRTLSKNYYVHSYAIGSAYTLAAMGSSKLNSIVRTYLLIY